MKKQKKIKKLKIPSIKKLKDKCWIVCSEYVRRKYADRYGMVRCYTCGIRKPWKEIQAGHAIPGRHNAILFHLKAIRPQCVACNIFKRGNYHRFHIELEKEFGFGILQELEAVDNQIKQFTITELEELIEWFKNEIKKFIELEKQNK